MHKLILLLLVIGANSIVSLPAFAQNDSISTYDGWITASFDALDEDNNQRAEQCLKNAMRLEPANPQNGLLFVNLGTIQRRLGKLQDAEIEQYQKAIDDYSVVISRNPEDEDALYERALCRLMNSDTIGARLDLETIDKFNPKSAKSRLGMAMVYKAMGENAMAVELYDALIKANPKSWSLLRDRAEVYFFSKRLGAAMLDIDKSIQMNGRDPLSYFLRAKIRWAKGDREYARRDLNRAIELGLPQSAAADLIEKMK